MAVDKQVVINNIEQSLLRANVKYRHFANGHFRVFFPGGNDMLDFWATTGKYKLAGGEHYHVGLDDVAEFIRRGYKLPSKQRAATVLTNADLPPW